MTAEQQAQAERDAQADAAQLAGDKEIVKRSRERGQKYVELYDQLAGGNGDELADVVDVLTDLRHYCQATRIDFDRAAATALGHFVEEHANARRS